MPTIRLTEQLFDAAERKAAAGGYASVDAFVSDVLEDSLSEPAGAETPDLGHLFTPERLQQIDAGAQQIDAGNSYTTAQANAELASRRAEWLQNNRR